MPKTIYIGDERHAFDIPDAPTRPLTFTGDSGVEHTIPLKELILFSDKIHEQAFWVREELPDYFTHYIPVSMDAKGEECGTKLYATEKIGDTETYIKDSVWERRFPAALNVNDSDHLIYLFDREMYRRRNGVHFKNGDHIEYITGHHYALLQWIKPYGLTEKLIREMAPWMPKGYEYAVYREFQRDIFYLIEKANNDPDILGLYIAKPKKTGVTQCLAAYYLNKALLARMQQMGVMSKAKDAWTVNMLMIQHGYDGLPAIFQATLKNRADKGGDMFFGEPTLRNVRTKGGKNRQRFLMDSKPLNTRIYAAVTKVAGFDSPTMTDEWFDEFAKYWASLKVSPKDVFNSNQEAVKIQDIINGKIWISFYPPEIDDKGFVEARDIYYASKRSTIAKGQKRTKTGLIVHYISSVLSYTSTFNKYGKCDEIEAHRRNQEERNKVRNDKKAYQAKIRQYSETEKECWAFAGAGSTFDAVRVGQLMTDLEEAMRTAGRLFVDGRLVWENVLWEAGAKNTRPLKTFGRVKFVPLTEEQILAGEEGRLRLYYPLPVSEQCLPLRMGMDEKGNLNPLRTFRYGGGADPTEWNADSEVIQGSKNGFYTMALPDLIRDLQWGKTISKAFISEYLYRPDNPQEAYEDLVKEIIFFGKRMIVEANKAAFATKLMQDGLGHYMIVKNKDTGLLVPWTPDLERDNKYSLVRKGETEGETIVSALATYIVPPDVKNGDTSPDYGASIRSERLLDQMSKFSKETAKLWDLVNAAGYAIMCVEAMMATPATLPEDPLYSDNMVWAVYQGLNAA